MDERDVNIKKEYGKHYTIVTPTYTQFIILWEICFLFLFTKLWMFFKVLYHRFTMFLPGWNKQHIPIKQGICPIDKVINYFLHFLQSIKRCNCIKNWIYLSVLFMLFNSCVASISISNELLTINFNLFYFHCISKGFHCQASTFNAIQWNSSNNYYVTNVSF